MYVIVFRAGEKSEAGFNKAYNASESKDRLLIVLLFYSFIKVTIFLETKKFILKLYRGRFPDRAYSSPRLKCMIC